MTAAGDLLASRYRLVERIAVGGMGEVWRAQDLLIDRDVAVKTMKPEYVGDEDFRARFRAEARHAGRLAHPGIAAVYDYGEDAASAWLVMELVDGEALSATLRREGVLPVDRVLDLLAQTAAALQAAHDGGVVHRDVKPGNLLLRPDGTVKVTDFGVASATDAVPLTRTGHVIGTAYYLSPEQAAGRSGSPASDVYALGVVAYECLTGSRPFPGANPVAVALAHLRSPVPPLPVHVPVAVRSLVARALAKDPQERFRNAAALSLAASAARTQLSDLPVIHAGSAAVSGAADRGLAGVDQRADALETTDLLAVVPVGPSPRPARPPRSTRPRRDLPGTRPRAARHAVTAAAAVLAVLTVGLGAQSLATTPVAPEVDPVAQEERTSPSAAPSASTVPDSVDVVAADWLGRPATQVRAALTDLGLVPRLAYDGRGRPVGTVSGMEPAGVVELGSTVLLHVVPAAAPVAAPDPLPAAPAPAPAPVPKAGKGEKGSSTADKGKSRDGK